MRSCRDWVFDINDTSCAKSKYIYPSISRGACMKYKWVSALVVRLPFKKHKKSLCLAFFFFVCHFWVVDVGFFVEHLP